MKAGNLGVALDVSSLTPTARLYPCCLRHTSRVYPIVPTPPAAALASFLVPAVASPSSCTQPLSSAVLLAFILLKVNLFVSPPPPLKDIVRLVRVVRMRE